VVLTGPIISVGMMAGGLVPEAMHSDVVFFLFTRMPLLVLAAIGLAIFYDQPGGGTVSPDQTSLRGGEAKRYGPPPQVLAQRIDT
jgi:hypothetical protein